MKRWAYYSEWEPYAAEWLRNLITCELIPDGEVDTRDLWDVRPDDIRHFAQVHVCAGIAVWAYALRQAGWPDDREIWSGSMPCQPFSAAGEGRGFDDERHLWPAFHYLIEQCRPPIVVGEQVASKDAGPWVDLVHTDLEALGYAFGAVPFPAASIGAPHIRDRLYWVAHTDDRGRRDCGGLPEAVESDEGATPRQGWHGFDGFASCGGAAGGAPLANAAGRGCRVVGGEAGPRDRGHPDCGEPVGGVAHGGGGEGLEERERDGRVQRAALGAPAGQTAVRGSDPGPVNGFWADAEWIWCRDGKYRPVKPGLEPLAYGPASRMAASRTGTLRGYGNALCAPQAIEFIRAVLDCRP